MRRTACAVAALLATAGAAAALPDRDGTGSPRPVLARVTAPLAHSNSRDGHAILSADGLRPGDRRSGEVTLRNHGGPGQLALVTRAAGPLAGRLRLTVTDTGGGPALIDAPLTGVPPCQVLDDLPEDASRDYRFTVAFERGAGDDAYAGASARADFEWLDRCEPTPTPTTALALGDTRLAVEPGPYRFSGPTGTARVAVRCAESPSGSCAGRIELERRSPGQGRGIALAVGRFRVGAGARRVVTLRLNARARRRIRSRGFVPVRAYVTATDASGRRHRAAYRDRLLYGRARR